MTATARKRESDLKRIVAAFEGMVNDYHRCLVGLEKRVDDLEARVHSIRNHAHIKQIDSEIQDLAGRIFQLKCWVLRDAPKPAPPQAEKMP